MTQRATTTTILFSLPLYKVFLSLFVFKYINICRYTYNFGICKKHTKYKIQKNICRNLLNKKKKNFDELELFNIDLTRAF